MSEPTAGDRQEGVPFIGAGPGDPGLLTVRGRELCEEADLVVHAGSLVNSELLEEFCADAEQVTSIGKDLEELVPLMRDAYREGRTVVRLHSGDPAIYGAALEQMDALESEDVPTYFVPGVTAAFAASATLRTQLTLNEASWPDEDVIHGTVETIGEQVEAAGYRASALVVVGDAVGGEGYERSYLYGGWANRGGETEADD